jgi:hypothetical protein
VLASNFGSQYAKHAFPFPDGIEKARLQQQRQLLILVEDYAINLRSAN